MGQGKRPFFSAFYTLAVDNTRTRTRLPLGVLPTPHLQCGMNLSQGAVRLPPLQVIKDRTAGRQVRRNRPPLTSGAQHIQEPLEDFPDIHRPLAAAPFRWGNQGSKLPPLFLGHITGIA